MDVRNAIENRVTTYRFSERDVSEEMVVNIINSAISAPAAGGVREYEFIIVTDKLKKQELSRICLTPNIDSAPFMLLIICDKSKLDSIFDEEESAVLCVENAALAIENALLAATDYGLGSAWVATLQQEPIKKLLEIPEKYIVRGVIPMGYAEIKSNKPFNKPTIDIGKIVHLEKFNNNAY